MTEDATNAAHVSAPTRLALLRVRPDMVLLLAVVGVFLANVLVSLAIPNSWIWRDNEVQGYLMNMIPTLLGLHLVFPPILLVQDLLQGQASSSFAPYILWWAVGVASVVFVMMGAKRVPWGVRAVYAYFIGAQLAAFGAVHWSTLGN